MPIPFMAIGLGISAISSGVNLISGLSRKNKAQKALKNFRRQELNNITEGMRVSTLGAEMQTREAQRRFSTSVDALRSGGVRALVGGLGKQEQLQQAQQQMISADLDRQQRQIDMMRAQDEARIRNMIEARESSAIAGLGREISEGRNQAQQGAFGLAQTAFAGAAAQKEGLFGSGGGSGGGSANAATQPTESGAIPGETMQDAFDRGREYFVSKLGGGADLGSQFAADTSLLSATRALGYSDIFTSGLSSAGAPQVAFSGPTGYNMEHAGFVKQ